MYVCMCVSVNLWIHKCLLRYMHAAAYMSFHDDVDDETRPIPYAPCTLQCVGVPTCGSEFI